MKTYDWLIADADEPRLRAVAELISLKIRSGDRIALHGDLGAGKTTFARYLIRALLGNDDAEVPSPTFPILQTYETPRLGVAHLDLYRIGEESEVAELGLEDLTASGAIIVEWPERAPSVLTDDRLDIVLAETDQPNQRTIRLTAHGDWTERLQRLEQIAAFLSRTQWRHDRLSYLQGDASSRAYARLGNDAGGVILMDWPRQPDGPPIRDGLPYSRIAHLAEGVPAFCDIAALLIEKGYRAPRILAHDLEWGLLVIEDLGDRVFGREVASGAALAPLWRAATETLVSMREFMGIETVTGPGGVVRALPPYDARALGIEVELLPDWYWPLVKGAPIPAHEREEFLALWQPLITAIAARPAGLTLRDYHSPNLLWRPEEPQDQARVGIIDFQDAVRGHPAYDLVSLLQDARLDVHPEVERDLLNHYVDLAKRREQDFCEGEFRRAYAVLGAQRNTKILGIFARLWLRDAKPAYLRHIPRIWTYVARNLDHPQLEALKSWYDRNFPPSGRTRVLDA